MKEYNPAVARLVMPARIAKLPVDERGYPVPRFVAWLDGKPDFRVVDAGWVRRCTDFGVCWICGEVLGRHKAFTIGPMCAVNRVTAEPPSHLDCARFSVRSCPFLTQPKRIRNEHDLPEGHSNPGGVMIRRNPGVTLIWITRDFKQFKADGGKLIHIGDPDSWEWWACGRLATREEVLAAINTGLPALREIADQEGPKAVGELARQEARARLMVPA